MTSNINGLECIVEWSEDGKRTIVMINGFNGSKDSEHRSRRAGKFVEEGYRVVRWDYRSKTSGEPTKSLTEDLEDLLSLIDHFDCEVLLVGSSWGGQIALRAVTRDERIKAVAVRSPAVDLDHTSKDHEVQNSHVTSEKFFQDLKDYDSYQMAEEIDVPSLIFAGSKDKRCPLKFTEKLVEEIPEPKKLVIYDIPHEWPEDLHKESTEKMLSWFEKWS